MNLLVLFTFAFLCAVAVESRYPYEDSYIAGDIVPHGPNSRRPYDRDRARYPVGGKHRSGGGGGGGYIGILNRRNNRYGRHRDDGLYADRRRQRDYDSYLPPRGIGGHSRGGGGYAVHDYEYRRNRGSNINGPPKYYDEDEINHGGYNRDFGLGIRYN